MPYPAHKAGYGAGASCLLQSIDLVLYLKQIVVRKESAMITLPKNPEEAIVIDEDFQGNFKRGHCIACGASGFVDGLGFPYSAKNISRTSLKHRMECPLNAVLDDNGNLKKEEPKPP